MTALCTKQKSPWQMMMRSHPSAVASKSRSVPISRRSDSRDQVGLKTAYGFVVYNRRVKLSADVGRRARGGDVKFAGAALFCTITTLEHTLQGGEDSTKRSRSPRDTLMGEDMEIFNLLYHQSRDTTALHSKTSSLPALIFQSPNRSSRVCNILCWSSRNSPLSILPFGAPDFAGPASRITRSCLMA